MTIFCETNRLFLRSVQLEDSALIAKWKSDELLKKMSIGLNTVITEQNQQEDIHKSIELKQPYYIITIKNLNKSIGYVRLNWMDDTNYFGWLRFGLGEERGHGYAKEALYSYIEKVFKSGTKRIDAEVYEFNKISFNLLQSIGFMHEGTRRKAYYSNNVFSDVHTLGLLQSDLK
ncbi:GNAT family N-acetyltransferase [Chengkuizengella axinellae]|uniref:GNAT family protein n=1 Tax=Chengkuizengella axinellae TaxID=3064388 RepID=A0ABT9J3S5_9BACL|nr:GNAT family protein [Chengkuizengella sp. 2205SS18-9]MDP5276282.1 GNAT family protein [Chengkuizengella sp. 2205SS18-9]